jgi:DNA-binding transcriptional MocR family regulator
MRLPPFLLEHWLATYEHATPPIRFNLGSSAGPRWTLGELFALDDSLAATLSDTRITYAPPAGLAALRQEIAALTGTESERVIVTTGASEAMSILFCLAAKSAANGAAGRRLSGVWSLGNAWGLGVDISSAPR